MNQTQSVHPASIVGRTCAIVSESSVRLGEWFYLFAACLCCFITQNAFGQSPPMALFTATLTVTPEVAAPGVTRALLIDGVWANGCIPIAASLRTADSSTVVIELQRAPESVCTLATKRFSFTLGYTPTQAGTQSVRIQTDDGARGGEGSITTADTRAIFVLTPIISVVPDVDIPNRQRTIVISGQTYAGCPFMTPVIDGVLGLTLGGVVIRLDPAPTFAPCNTNAFSPYRFELPYTPTAVGTQRVLAVSSSGGIRSESTIRTAAAQGSTRAVGDISGSWYDPATNGSGIQFTHSFTSTDAVLGTAYLYDPAGRARWLTMQNMVWQAAGTLLVGDLLETKASTILCDPTACPDVVLPRRFSTVTKIGTVRISFTGLGPYSDTLPQGLVEAFSATGALMFRMDITRLFL